MESLSIVCATLADLPAITDIYRHHVLNGTGTFETTAPDLAAMQSRWQEVRDRDLPWLVAREADEVVGYAYANWFRPRLAYAYTVEDSIYVHPQALGRGIGGALLDALVKECTARGRRQMLAVIGDADNAGSIGLHRSRGFAEIGRMPAVGWKFGRWLDVVLMQRALGPGATTSPA